MTPQTSFTVFLWVLFIVLIYLVLFKFFPWLEKSNTIVGKKYGNLKRVLRSRFYRVKTPK